MGRHAHCPAGVAGVVEVLVHKIQYEESNNDGDAYSHGVSMTLII